MKRTIHIITTLLVLASILFANPYIVLADEGDSGIHELEVKVNGYHVTLANEGGWAKGENTVIVTIADEMGIRLTDAKVELLIAPKTAAGHEAAEAEGHSVPEEDVHATEPQGHGSMSDMEMSTATEEVDSHGTSSHTSLSHGEEGTYNPVAMREADEHGLYIAETHLEDLGEHEVLVMFHVNGEMIEAGFTVQIPGSNSKYVVLWSFVLINLGLIVSAGYIKKQTALGKGVI